MFYIWFIGDDGGFIICGVGFGLSYFIGSFMVGLIGGTIGFTGFLFSSLGYLIGLLLTYFCGGST